MSYMEERYNLILHFEESGNPKKRPYVDHKGKITIGAGFNIKYDENRPVADLVDQRCQVQLKGGWVQLLQVQEPLLAKQIFQKRYKVGLKNETQQISYVGFRKWRYPTCNKPRNCY